VSRFPFQFSLIPNYLLHILVALTHRLEAHSPIRRALELYEDQIEELPVSNLDSAQLQTAIHWLETHHHSDYQLVVDPISNQCLPVALSEVDRAVVEGREPEFYPTMLEAAHFLGIPSLGWALNQTLAAMIVAMSDDEKRHFLRLPDDLSPKQKEDIKKRDHWAGV